MPQVDFDLGEMYSGLVPIAKNDTSRQLFFIFQPKLGAPVDEVTIWLNGGPGCSSLEGFFQENGRFLWQPGTFKPVENYYSWVNLTNMLWVDQPVGTGFSTGTPTAVSQEETAQDFVKFFLNWQQLFGIKNFKIYVTGESYAGRYVPYISAAMLNENNKTYYDLSGALMFDPCIGNFEYVQEEVPVVPFVLANNNLFNFNASFLSQLEMLHQNCGYATYIDKYLTFPPPGNQPPFFMNFTNQTDLNCDVFDLVNEAAFDPNPCFNIYAITEMCPIAWDVLNFPTELNQAQNGSAYFNRSDVKKALHAPDIPWYECSIHPVFVGNASSPPEYGEGDYAADSIQAVLPQVIEATNRVLVSNGDYDMVILTNGTLMSIQNMTWGGKLGFQTAPSTPINIMLPDLQYQALFDQNDGLGGFDGPQGIMGIQHFERGLMWAETYMSGHMQPEFQPRVTYRYLQWLLGRTQTI